MKIVYDKNNNFYCINLEHPETELYIVADNIVEVREKFIRMMTNLFDYTIQDSLKD